MSISVSMKGFGEEIATFTTSDADLATGDPVVLSGNNAVEKADSAELFAGVCAAVRNGVASVQLSGYREVAYSGTAPTVGWQSVCADGNGGIAVNSSGRQHLVISVDTAAATCGIII